ncbi:trigger factor [Conchiformibius steedae DSM 2580]|uniref:Trigger factor n=2 Tax=Conchiformibius steedae TaxID=153493 RepID=A0A3P2A7B7_9NEIS|nr:trigger factor [Conchiformibius steedae]QMT34420.1 trigger factor [Conchiformibius steedae]RRD91297.1 trigger factor [Conchiformibius steedae]URD67201.1 trigger factor [Conchiformibius steedae DSM 2580]
MSATVENLENLERKLVVSIAWENINAETAKRLKDTARRVRIDGFRPGKAPLKMVESMYGAGIQNEVLNDLAQQAFQQAVAEQNIAVAALLRLDAVEGQAEDAADFQVAFVFETFPEVNIGDLSALEVNKAAIEVGEAEVDKTIDILRKQRTRYTRVERAAQDGDRVIIDFEGKIDGVPFEGGSAQNYAFVLGQGQMLPEFEAGVSGLKEGESKEVSVNFPEDYHGKDVAGKTAVFNITVNNVAEAELPEVDEQFAKALGIEDGDLAKMRAEILKNVSREAKRRVAAKNADAVMTALRQHVPLQLPRALVADEAERLAAEMRENFSRQGLDAQNLDLPAAMFTDRAEQNVALGLIVPELIEQNKLQPTEEQVKNIVLEFAESYEDPQEVVDWYFSDRERLQEPTNLALQANVVEFVFGKAKVTEQALSFDEVMSGAA